jgi:hypothetical protein
MKAALLAFLFVALFAACSRNAEDDWWTSMTSPGKTMLEVTKLAPHEKKSLSIGRTGTVRLGVLVRQVFEMKKSLEESRENRGVFLSQNSSDKYVGTAYSASVLFDMSFGQDFTLENRSSIACDVAVYFEPQP